MKKVLIVIICAAAALSLAACAQKDNAPAGASASGIFAAESSSANTSIKSSDALEENNGKETQAAGVQRQSNTGKGTIDMKSKLAFSGKTVDGKAVDSSVFKGFKLTMINVWGTLCKPCIEEMPDIEALYQEMKSSQVNVIGFVANVLGGEDAGKITEEQRSSDAKKILDAKGVTYMNIVFDDAETDQINRQISGFPTTLFVDGEGNVAGGQISGPKSREGYKEEIENRLKETGK